jgi:cytochrome c-type biogenesis protein CcmE
MSDLDPLQEWNDKNGDLEARRSKKPLGVLGIGALVAILLMSFSVFKKSVVYYKTPTEVAQSPGVNVRVSGTVVPGSIQYDEANGVTTFRVTDKTTTIDVSFNGTKPDTLKDNAQAVAEGKYQDGVFRANTLFAKCPSKFGSSPPPAGV